MRFPRRSLTAAAVLAAAAASVVPAQGTPPAASGAAPAAAAPAPAGVRQEIVKQLEDAERKFIALAEAIPQEKYSWRPAEGVRSVSEVLVHVAGANFMMAGMAGAAAPTGVTLSQEMEKTVTDRAQIVDLLRKSFAHAKQAVTGLSDADLDAPVTIFGQPTTKRGTYVMIATHAHEHLGQSIAYARTNGIAPPWSGGGN